MTSRQRAIAHAHRVDLGVVLGAVPEGEVIDGDGVHRHALRCNLTHLPNTLIGRSGRPDPVVRIAERGEKTHFRDRADRGIPDSGPG